VDPPTWSQMPITGSPSRAWLPKRLLALPLQGRGEPSPNHWVNGGGGPGASMIIPANSITQPGADCEIGIRPEVQGECQHRGASPNAPRTLMKRWRKLRLGPVKYGADTVMGTSPPAGVNGSNEVAHGDHNASSVPNRHVPVISGRSRVCTARSRSSTPDDFTAHHREATASGS